MNLFARALLLAWPVVSTAFFLVLPPRRAVLAGLFAGWLFLPVARLEAPGMPDYGKSHAIAIGALLGASLFDPARLLSFRIRAYDLPAFGWCLSAGAASLSNHLGSYDAASAVVQHVMTWGCFYFLGRVYFADLPGLRALTKALFYGGLVYVPLCLLEIRLSPQLHTWLYGFHQHSFAQSFRGEGWRPVVFMEHGLAVGLWMCLTALAGLWLWKAKQLPPSLLGLPSGAWVLLLFATAVLCKSTGALALLAAGLAAFALRRTRAAAWIPAVLLCIPPAYIVARSSGLWSGRDAVDLVARFSSERAESLSYRFRAEDMLAGHALRRPFFGWGGFGRNRPATFDLSAEALATDGFWIIALGTFGGVGLLCALGVLLLGPAVFWCRLPAAAWGADRPAPAIVAALVLLLFTVDCLFNAMVSPLYLLIGGGLAAAASAPAPAPRAAEVLA